MVFIFYIQEMSDSHSFIYYCYNSVTEMSLEGPDEKLIMANHIPHGNLDSKRLKAAGRLSQNLVHMIEKEIQKSKFDVNDVQKEFKLRQQKGGEAENERKGNFSQWKKYQKEGQQYSTGDRSSEKERHLHHSNSERKYFKSEMSQEQKERIKNLKIAQKKHEMELEKKRRLFEENIRKLEEEEKQLMERQRKQKNEERIKDVTKKIAEIRARQHERTRRMEEENKKIHDLKHEKTLYERLDSKYKTVELQAEKKKEELKLAMKRQKNVDFQEIKEHERKYDDIMRSQKEEREKKLGDLTRGNSKKYYHSKLLKDQIEQDQLAKAEHVDRRNEVLERFSSQKQYAEMVRTKIKPHMTLKENDLEDKTTTPAQGASFSEQVKLGNDYMKSVHENLASLKGSSVSKVMEKKEEPFRYKDYLKDLRGDRKPSSQKEGRYFEQIENLMKNDTMSQKEKFEQARLLTKKIEENKKGRNSQKLISTINAKLHLLKQIETNSAED